MNRVKHVLLTGGLGFVGTHTVELFLRNTDWNITVLDSLRFSGRVERLIDIEGYDPLRSRVFWHDLRSPIHGPLLEQIGDVDYIINMASDSHVDRSIVEPVPFVHNNVMLMLNMLEYAREVKPEKFIQIGTDEQFGPAPEGHSHTEDDPLRPSNPYAASKASQAMIGYSWWRTFGVPLILTQTMNMIGERQHPEKFVPMTIGKVIRGETVQIHARPEADGSWTPGSRVWLHARNHADALLFLLKNVMPLPYGVGELNVFNIAGEREVDNYEMAASIAELLNLPLKYEWIDFHSQRPGHDLRYSLDGSKLRTRGWSPPLPLSESLERTVRWSEKNHHWL